MYKKCLNIIMLLLAIFLLTSCFGSTPNDNERENADLDELFSTGETLSEIEKEEKTRNEKLESLKSKLAMKGLIAKGDLLYAEKEYAIALAQYLQVLKNIPDDGEINMKIGNIYYEQKKFDKAYEYYKKIKSYSGLDTKKAIYSLVNSRYKGVNDITRINKEIDSFPFTKEELFYYKNSILCLSNFSKCRANFEEYFNKLEANTEIEFSDLQEIKNSFTNYKNFQLEDLNYKAALVTGGFYKNGFYLVSMKTGEDILKTNENYKPILKIVAKSAYELGDYTIAKDYLLKYNNLEVNDPEASYFMGRIYEKLGDKILSTIHYTKALTLNYDDANSVRRRLIFVYFDLDETKKMLATFKDLINSNDPNLTINDFNLAIYYNILNDNLATAMEYSKKAKKLFPNSELFPTYYAWILLQKNKLKDEELADIKNNIDSALNINTQNPMLAMVEGLYYLKTGDNDKALLRFKTASTLDKGKEYRDMIEYFLNQTPNERKK